MASLMTATLFKLRPTPTTNWGGIVYFPPGTHKILSGLTVDATIGANITILGTGGGATSNGGTIIVGDFNDWLLRTSNKAPIELIDRSVAYARADRNWLRQNSSPICAIRNWCGFQSTTALERCVTRANASLLLTNCKYALTFNRAGSSPCPP
jgi:hypothetical protein